MQRGFENFFSALEIPVTAATIILHKSVKVFLLYIRKVFHLTYIVFCIYITVFYYSYK